MSKAVTKTLPKGPWYLLSYAASSSTFPPGPKIPMAFTTMKPKRILTANKPTTSRAPANSTAITSNPTLYTSGQI